MEAERSLISAFVSPSYRRRCLELLTTPHGRERLRHELAHFKGIDSRFSFPIPSNQQTARGIHNVLMSRVHEPIVT